MEALRDQPEVRADSEVVGTYVASGRVSGAGGRAGQAGGPGGFVQYEYYESTAATGGVMLFLFCFILKTYEGNKTRRFCCCGVTNYLEFDWIPDKSLHVPCQAARYGTIQVQSCCAAEWSGAAAARSLVVLLVQYCLVDGAKFSSSRQLQMKD